MTCRLAIVTSALFSGAVLLVSATGEAADRAEAGPLPVAETPVSAPPAVPVPKPDGTGLKSGSSEALAVQLEGAKVLSAEGNVIGEVERLIERPAGESKAVLGIGGILGIGEQRVLVPAESLSPSGNGVVRSDLSEAQIRHLPAFDD